MYLAAQNPVLAPPVLAFPVLAHPLMTLLLKPSGVHIPPELLPEPPPDELTIEQVVPVSPSPLQSQW